MLRKTPSAFMNYTEFSCCAFYADRFHHAAAVVRSVPGFDVHMLTPEAFWTMIRVSCAYNLFAAMFAREVLFISYESHGRVLVSYTMGEKTGLAEIKAVP